MFEKSTEYPEVLTAEESDSLVRQLWAWAAWACPDGVPEGWLEEERPQ